jgi:integrase
MDRAPVPKHPGVTRRTWRTDDGRTEVRFDAQYRGLDRKKHLRSFRTLGAADRWLREQRADVDRGTWRDPERGKGTLAAFYGWWRAQAVEHGRPTERTLIAYDEVWRLYIAPKLGSRSLNAITRADIEAIVQGAATKSAWRAHDTLKVVRRLLSAAVDAERITRNPAARVQSPRIEEHEPWVLTTDEVDRLAMAVPDRYRALVLVGAYGSLRWSELVALKLDRLDLMRRRVRIEEKTVEAGHLINGEPKTKRSRRWVTLPESVAFALAEHVRQYPPGPDGLVFTAPQGGPIRRPAFGRLVWTKATKAAKLDGFPFRNLRHTGATMALQAGVNPVLVAFRLGHTSTAMVEKQYGRLIESMDADIADRLDTARHRRGAGPASRSLRRNTSRTSGTS